MDAVKFIKEEHRMCLNYKTPSKNCCLDCPCYSMNNATNEICIKFRKTNPEKYVAIVEKWSAEHPIKTRQSELLKMFPNAKTNKDGISICPRVVDTKHECEGKVCEGCIKEYWHAGVE